MKKAGSLLPLVLLFVIPLTGQVEHALIPEQCKADANAWNVPVIGRGDARGDDAPFSDLATRAAHDPNVTVKQLNARKEQLNQCAKIDSFFAPRYTEANRAYAIAELGRMTDFMQRHNLMSQFYSEDEQGKR